jgi:DNA-binding CsgD family transcriptional regulator
MAMNADRIGRLTDKQRECLRMVYRHMETKEIARVLGLSPDGVSQRIKTAMKTLGVDRRRDAALILAEAEGFAPYPRQVYPSRDIASAPEPAMLVPSTGGEGQHRFSGETIREEQAAFMVAGHGREPTLPLPRRGARLNDVEWQTRLAWIAGIAIGIALAFGGLVGGVEALTRLIRG